MTFWHGYIVRMLRKRLRGEFHAVFEWPEKAPAAGKGYHRQALEHRVGRGSMTTTNVPPRYWTSVRRRKLMWSLGP